MGVNIVTVAMLLLQRTPGEHQPRRLAADLAIPDAPVIDIAQVADLENVLGYADIGQLVADQSLD